MEKALRYNRMRVAMVIVALMAICMINKAGIKEVHAENEEDDLWTYTIDEEDGSATLTKYKQTANDVEVPATVTDQEGTEHKVTKLRNTFNGAGNLTSIVIPSGVEEIGDYTFKDCNNLRVVKLPDTLTKIGYNAFESCQSLKNITLPEGLKEIGSYSFKACTYLQKITIPKSVTVLGNCAFSSCTALKEVNMSDESEFTNLYGSTFSRCTSLTSINIPAGFKEIPANFCDGCEKLETVTVSEDAVIESIGTYAFRNCQKLVSFTMPSGVKNIYNYAFYDCYSLSSVTFPSTLEYIGTSAFEDCTSLKYADMDSCTSGGVDIGRDVGYNNAYNVFEGCTALERATVTQYANFICQSAFSRCEKLDNVKIKAATIKSYAFDSCSGLTNLQLQEGVETIGGSAFSDCGSLESVYIPSSVNNILGNAWSNCDELKQISVSEQNSVYDSRDNCNAIIETDTDRLIVGCQSTVIPTSVKILGPYCFAHLDDLEEVKYASGTVHLETIEHGAFQNCSSLTELKIPVSVKEIKDDPFSYCPVLESIEIPDGIPVFESNFQQCYQLKSAKLPWGIETAWGVGQCTSMKSVYIPSSTKEIASSFLYKCNPEKIYYYGTKEMWDQLEFMGGNDAILEHEITFIEGNLHISQTDIKMDQTEYEYTGKPIIPKISLSFRDISMRKDFDYELEYKDNTEPGTATIVIKGKGSFTGTKEVNFKITGSSEDPGDKTNPDGKTDPGKDDTKPSADDTFTVSGMKYKVLSSNTVSLIQAKNAKTVTVPATVKSGGKTYKVVRIGANAFKKSKATKVVIKTKNLKKATVKNSLEGSKVKKIQIKVGKKKVNKTCLKKYKKIFTKKNAGKKVTISL